MPLFEYAPLDQSGGESPCCHFEILQSCNEEPLTNCPTCGQGVARLFSAFGIGAGVAPNAVAATQIPKETTTAAGRVTNMLGGHVCSAGCRH